MRKLLGSLFIAVLFVFVACEEQNPVLEGFGDYSNGVFIVNEGGFGKNNGSLSFFSKDSNKIVNYAFMAANNENKVVDSLKVKIGDVFQSMTIINDEAYLVANNSQKITIVNMRDLTVVNTLENLSYPRFVVQGPGETAYISNGNGFGGDAVYVVNTSTHQITDTIAVGSAPERMLLSGDKLFIGRMAGYLTGLALLDIDDIYVIDVNTNRVIKTISTGDLPGEMVKDKNGDVWVLAKGATVFDDSWTNIIGTSNAKLSKIDPQTLTVTDSIVLNSPMAYNSSFLSISKDGSSVYINNNDILEIDLESQEQNTFISNAGWYGLDIDPKTGYIWGFQSVFGSNGKVVVYSETGNKLFEYQVGEGPNSAVFID